MNDKDTDQLRELLLRQRGEILGSAAGSRPGDLEHDQDDAPDEMDMAVAESSTSFVGRLRERETELLGKINEALARIEEGDYGECEGCGEDIGTKRLLAHPVAILCIDCKGAKERSDRSS
jgi:DnaK suppressor protein